MFVGLIIRLSPESPIRDSVTFDYQFFFNLLLPPIILASGYELHQVSLRFMLQNSALASFNLADMFSCRRISSAISVPSSRLPLPEPSSPPLCLGLYYTFGPVFL